jgi:hypothetical protein
MACDNVADDGACAAGQLCVPAKGGCIEAKACNSGVDCQDGNLCNGIEICDTALHICQAGTPKICNDGIACTGDSCDANTGNCVYVANDAQCDDGLACNGVEQCSPSSGCVVGTTVNCNDGVSCTLDSCNEPTGTCSHVAQNAVCNDGFFCNGTEVCDVQAGCVDGTPPTCSDGISCTTDVCDIMFDKCVGVADDSKCPCAQSCDPTQGCGNFCQVTTCQGKTYDCGNCLDDDGDCKVDQGDEMCLGPCDNSETGFDLAIPGGNNAPCKQDCYFDGDTGAGNDGCYWSHSCDPYEVAPNYDPEGSKCAYDPMAGIPGTGLGCAEAFAAQAPSCLGVCGPLTPNGCDCFGCCLVPGAAEPVWLGSKDSKDTPTCTLDALDDPSKCRPCTQVEACLNTCDTCELCVGKYELPAECQCQICPVGAQMCGAPCGTPCPFGEFCNSGCCVAAP